MRESCRELGIQGQGIQEHKPGQAPACCNPPPRAALALNLPPHTHTALPPHLARGQHPLQLLRDLLCGEDAWGGWGAGGCGECTASVGGGGGGAATAAVSPLAAAAGTFGPVWLSGKQAAPHPGTAGRPPSAPRPQQTCAQSLKAGAGRGEVAGGLDGCLQRTGVARSAMASRRAPAHPAPRRPRAAAACRRWLPARRWSAVQGPVKGPKERQVQKQSNRSKTQPAAATTPAQLRAGVPAAAAPHLCRLPPPPHPHAHGLRGAARAGRPGAGQGAAVRESVVQGGARSSPAGCQAAAQASRGPP